MHVTTQYIPRYHRATRTSVLPPVDLGFRLQDEEIRRQELEDTEASIKQEEIRRLLMDYMVRGPTAFDRADNVCTPFSVSDTTKLFANLLISYVRKLQR